MNNPPGSYRFNIGSPDAAEQLPILLPWLARNPSVGRAAVSGGLFCLVSVPFANAYIAMENHFWPSETPFDPAEWPLMAVLAIFVAPWLETAFFQRFLMERIGYANRRRRWMGVALSATLFAAGHLRYEVLILHFSLGIMFSCIYLSSRGAGKKVATVATISAHFAHNALTAALVAWALW